MINNRLDSFYSDDSPGEDSLKEFIAKLEKLKLAHGRLSEKVTQRETVHAYQRIAVSSTKRTLSMGKTRGDDSEEYHNLKAAYETLKAGFDKDTKLVSLCRELLDLAEEGLGRLNQDLRFTPQLAGDYHVEEVETDHGAFIAGLLEGLTNVARLLGDKETEYEMVRAAVAS